MIGHDEIINEEPRKHTYQITSSNAVLYVAEKFVNNQSQIANQITPTRSKSQELTQYPVIRTVLGGVDYQQTQKELKYLGDFLYTKFEIAS